MKSFPVAGGRSVSLSLFSDVSNSRHGEPEKLLIIHIGPFGREKNLDFLKTLSGVRIAFIGDRPYRPELEKIFEGMPAVFTGMMQGEELSQAYASGDVFVMPSESETLGQVVLDSMSSGVPVVMARAGGIPDIIPEDQEGKTSFLFTPGNLDDCVGKIQLLLTNKEFGDNMGTTARAEMEKYDWRAASRQIWNEFYNVAIWYWRKKRAELIKRLQWLAQMFLPAPEISSITQY